MLLCGSSSLLVGGSGGSSPQVCFVTRGKWRVCVDAVEGCCCCHFCLVSGFVSVDILGYPALLRVAVSGVMATCGGVRLG